MTQSDRVDKLTGTTVVGQDELESRSVNVRNRDDIGTKARSESVKLDAICAQLLALKGSRSLHNKLQ